MRRGLGHEVYIGLPALALLGYEKLYCTFGALWRDQLNRPVRLARLAAIESAGRGRGGQQQTTIRAGLFDICTYRSGLEGPRARRSRKDW